MENVNTWESITCSMVSVSMGEEDTISKRKGFKPHYI